MRSTRWSGATASDEVSPYLTVSYGQVMPKRNSKERLPTGWLYLIFFCYLPCLYLVCVSRRVAPAHHQPGPDFGSEGCYRGSYLWHPSTSDRFQNGFKFVELARDMFSKCTRSRESQLGCYDRVARVEALYMYEDVGDVQLTHQGITWWLRMNTFTSYT